ncbi:MAG TPA: LysE/ArgO family amino acid transporter [Burkholderiaceae bacterium]
MSVAFLKGLGMGAGLIMAIGAQNAFVLRQGLLKRYVFICALICSLCDMVLISAGVAGMGSLIVAHPALLAVAKWGGALFLAYYGVRSALAAFKAGTLAAAPQGATGYAAAIAMAFSFSLLNPHVYLDTVVLLGAVGGQQPDGGRIEFALGAMSASVLWFFGLAYGARLLAPLFARPVAWRILDGLIAVVMWSLAASLLG